MPCDGFGQIHHQRTRAYTSSLHSQASCYPCAGARITSHNAPQIYEPSSAIIALSRLFATSLAESKRQSLPLQSPPLPSPGCGRWESPIVRTSAKLSSQTAGIQSRAGLPAAAGGCAASRVTTFSSSDETMRSQTMSRWTTRGRRRGDASETGPDRKVIVEEHRELSEQVLWIGKRLPKSNKNGKINRELLSSIDQERRKAR